MAVGYLRVLSGLVVFLEYERPSLSHIAERRGNVVKI
jgi:hypothetical protein